MMAHAGLAHLAGSDDHHRLPREVVPENLFGQFHTCAPDGRRPAPNSGPGPNFFHDLKGALKDAVQSSTGKLRGACSLIGLLDLAGDFRLAKNHRVHSSSNAKQVAHCLAVLINVGAGTKVMRLDAQRSE